MPLLRLIRRRIALKLTLTLVGFVGISVLAAGLYLNDALGDFAVESIEARLVSVARLLEAEARGRVLSREFLLDRVWGYVAAGEIESRTVDVHVRRLRVKLGAEGARITTVKGVGYRFEPED